MTYCVTHSGFFHADDVFGAAIIQLAMGATPVVRTRDKDIIEKAEDDGAIIFDVGLKYDGEATFDHHQHGGAGARYNGCPYAAAGLLWKAFGQKALFNCQEVPDGSEAQIIQEHVDRILFQGIDALDNGVCSTTTKIPNEEVVDIMSISHIISDYNPVEFLEGKNQEQAFQTAMELAVNTLKRVIINATAKHLGRRLLEKWAGQSEYPGLLILEHYVPWSEFAAIRTNIEYVIFESDGKWLCQCAPKSIKSGFVSRKYLPREWWAKNNQELVDITGVEDAVFTHKDGFICGAKTKEGCLRLAELAQKYE